MSIHKTAMSALKTFWWQLSSALGVPPHVPSYREQGAAVVTSMLGVAVVAAVGLWLAPVDAPWLLTSMGASAVLVFALPQGPLSQPWAVIGGHGLSACVALVIVHIIGGGVMAMALAVGGAIGVMHLARCIHPPGGATALYVVQAMQSAAAPQWSLLLSPVLLNVTCILLAACLFNYPFAWRRYPAAWAFRHSVQAMPGLSHEAPFSQRELAQALDGLDTVLEISDEQLQTLYEAIVRRQEQQPLSPAQLINGSYYSNGLQGEGWAVRQIIDANAVDARKPQLIVKTVAGQGRGTVQLITRQAFAGWARYPVYPHEGQWLREAPVVNDR